MNSRGSTPSELSPILNPPRAAHGVWYRAAFVFCALLSFAGCSFIVRWNALDALLGGAAIYGQKSQSAQGQIKPAAMPALDQLDLDAIGDFDFDFEGAATPLDASFFLLPKVAQGVGLSTSAKNAIYTDTGRWSAVVPAAGQVAPDDSGRGATGSPPVAQQTAPDDAVLKTATSDGVRMVVGEKQEVEKQISPSGREASQKRKRSEAEIIALRSLNHRKAVAKKENDGHAHFATLNREVVSSAGFFTRPWCKMPQVSACSPCCDPDSDEGLCAKHFCYECQNNETTPNCVQCRLTSCMPACLPCYYPPDGGTRAAQTLRTAANSQKGVHLNLSYTLLELFDGNANKTKTFSEKFEIGARERMNYSVYLPKHYNPKIDLLVYSSPAVPRPKYQVPANTGAIFQHLENVMDDFNMGWIGADNCGNLKTFARRVGCVMLATRVAARYGHRPGKTYAAGFSGGGLVASYVNTAYPMIFSGGIYIAGAMKWGNNEVGHETISWDPAFGSGLREHRFVFLTGDKDENLAHWRSVQAGYVHTNTAVS
jgi:hypothetical protein